MKRILVVPDVHGRTFWKEPVMRHLDDVDIVVFLGDYLDPYSDEDGLAPDIFENLMEIVELKRANREKVILLKGNHDEHYSSIRFCELAHGSRMDKQNWDKYHEFFNEYSELFKIAQLEEVHGFPYVFTHAGLTAYWLNKVNSTLWHMNDNEISISDPHIIEKINALDSTVQGQVLLSVVGKRRSFIGGEKTGSVLWADVNEHPTPRAYIVYGLSQAFQVFGHTIIDKGTNDMILFENLAMIDSQQCFIIDEGSQERIKTLRD